jgi:hypothetical protein
VAQTTTPVAADEHRRLYGRVERHDISTVGKPTSGSGKRTFIIIKMMNVLFPDQAVTRRLRVFHVHRPASNPTAASPNTIELGSGTA